jgi:exodeoxyribonuclease VII small subunit
MSNSACNLTFEQARAELEQVVHDLEEGQIGLEEALARYEKGVTLLKHCYSLLKQAEQRILVLTGTDAEGKPITQPFTPEAVSAEPKTKPAEGSRRREKKDQPSPLTEPSFFDS